MNKKIITIVGAAVVTLVLGIGIYQSDASQGNPQLTIDEVSDIVSNQYPGVITEVELERDDGQVKYEVEIDDGNKKYDLDIDANTGEVLKIKEKSVASNEKMKLEDNTKQAKAEEETKEKAKVETKEKSQEKPKEKSKEKSTTMIDAKQAIDIALGEFSGKVTDFELDEDDNRLIYEIEIENGREEAEIEIDAYTGEVLVIEIEND